MKTEPSVSSEEIKNKINQFYGISLEQLNFVPVGEGSWCYWGQAQNDIFVRLVKDKDQISLTNSLIKLLASLGVPIPIPLPDKSGQTVVKVANFGLVVYPYIPGLTLMKSDRTNQQVSSLRQAVGKMVGHLHSLTREISNQIELPIENFTKFQSEFRLIISPRNPIYQADQIVKDLLSFINVRRCELTSLVQVAEQLGANLRSREFDYVLCHGDIHEDNVLLSEKGNLYIIDWDGAILAPRERDLYFFGSESYRGLNKDNLRGYFASSGPVETDPVLMDYYTIEWALQEVVDYGSRILSDSRFDLDGRLDAWQQFQGLFEPNQDVDCAFQVAACYRRDTSVINSSQL